MTKEEQIDWLCRLRADLNNGVIFTPWNKEFREALTDLLEQEPCEDIIRRQAVLDALDKSKYSDEFCEEHHIDWSVNLGMAHIAVNELRPVTPEAKVWHWIDFSNGWMCSCCKSDKRKDIHYCPSCGKKIVGVIGKEEK